MDTSSILDLAEPTQPVEAGYRLDFDREAPGDVSAISLLGQDIVATVMGVRLQLWDMSRVDKPRKLARLNFLPEFGRCCGHTLIGHGQYLYDASDLGITAYEWFLGQP